MDANKKYKRFGASYEWVLIKIDVNIIGVHILHHNTNKDLLIFPFRVSKLNPLCSILYVFSLCSCVHLICCLHHMLFIGDMHYF